MARQMRQQNTARLVLLRHGESDWNALNLFTGWVDVGLTEKGRAEAVRSGELIAEHNLLPDVLYTSVLRRAISTAHLALDTADRLWIPVRRSWRLNERHYGALQGLDKAETKARYGEEQFMAWRRSYDTPPPPIERGGKFSQDTDPRYADIGGGPPPQGPVSAVLHRRHRPGFAVRQDGADRRAWQLPARAGQASRPDVRRRDRRPEHPDRHSVALRPGCRAATDGARRHLSGPTGGRGRRRRGRQPGCGENLMCGPKRPNCLTSRERQPNTCGAACDLSDFGLAPLGQCSEGFVGFSM